MNVLFLGDNDLIGNKFNGHDLHIYLQEMNVRADHLVLHKESTDANTHVFSIHNPTECFTKNIFYDQLFLNSDLLHLHLIHNTPFDLNYLPMLSKLKPIIWTIHDPWILSGHCVYHFDCLRWLEQCGDCSRLDTPFAISNDTTALNWALKQDAIKTANVAFIVASKWMADKVMPAPAFQNKKVYLLPFGINHDVFTPRDIGEAKTALNIAPDNWVIMFRADKSPFKGLNIIKSALTKLKTKRKVTLLTVGATGYLDEFRSKYDVREFGWIKNDLELVKLYQACDLFLMPSSQEAFGMMAIEAMSCGKTVLAIPGTALPDVINAPECGIVAKTEEYDAVLQKLLDDPQKLLAHGEKSLAYAKANYSKDVYVKRMTEIYAEVIAAHHPDESAKYILSQLKTYCSVWKRSATANGVKAVTLTCPDVLSAAIGKEYGTLSSAEQYLLGVSRRLKRVRFVYWSYRKIMKPFLRPGWAMLKKWKR